MKDEDHEYEWNATYCPEDNKLRLYYEGVGRFTDEDRETIKAAGYRWARLQECYVCPRWTPNAEDVALDMAGYIGDEDYSPQERAADRAERFAEYRDKRRDEAVGHADTYDSGPDVFGNQDARRAQRQADRHERHRGRAVNQWEKAEYWQHRTKGVISSARYKSSAKVRRGRIGTIEQDIRKIENSYTVDKKTPPMPVGHQWNDKDEPQYFIRNGSRGGQWVTEGQLKARKEASQRWLHHLQMRLAYERQMIGDQGGMVGDLDIEVGGWIGNHQIHGISKSPQTGRVTSVKIIGKWGFINVNGRSVYCDHPDSRNLVSVKIDRLGEDAYRPPTDEEREEFAKATKAAKAKAKAKRSTAPKLINPTPEDAQRLQDAWNAKYAKLVDDYNARGGGYYGIKADYTPVKVIEMTQAQYAARSKGSYARANTVMVMENGLIDDSRFGKTTARSAPIAFKVRKTDPNASHSFSHSAYAVIILTDKPQKPLPLDWEAIANPVQENSETAATS